jgi:hypothetical protein
MGTELHRGIKEKYKTTLYNRPGLASQAIGLKRYPLAISP